MRNWYELIGQVRHQVVADRISVIAAGVAFYGLLALFPTLVAIISIFGIAFDPQQMMHQMVSLTRLLPDEAADFLSEQLTQLTSSGHRALRFGTAGSVIVALWSSSAGVRTLMQALNVTYDLQEQRGFLVRIGLSVGFAALMMLGMLVAMTAIVVLPIIGSVVALPGQISAAVSWLRWPIVALAFWLALIAIYRYGPDRRTMQRPWISWGAVTALVIWLGASLLFSTYVACFGTFNRTYGSMGAVVVLLFWMLLSAWAVLIGAEVNASLERTSSSGRQQ